jgi:hypothetical protein
MVFNKRDGVYWASLNHGAVPNCAQIVLLSAVTRLLEFVVKWRVEHAEL